MKLSSVPLDPADVASAAHVATAGPDLAPALVPPPDSVSTAAHPGDPAGFYRRLREGAPLWFDPVAGLWVASRADVVREALRHPALRVRPVDQPVPPAIAGRPAGEVYARMVRMTDGPGQRHVRQWLVGALSAVPVAEVARQTQDAARLLPSLPLDDWLSVLPLAALAGLIGFPAAQRLAVAREGRAFAACISPLATPSQLAAADLAAESLDRRLLALCRSGHAPAGSLADALGTIAGPDAGTVRANLIGLFAQACDGTAGLIGSSLLAWASQARVAASRRSAADSFDALVASTAMQAAPIQNTRRFVARPCTLGGLPLAPGDTVLLLLASANHEVAKRAAGDDGWADTDVGAGAGAGAVGAPHPAVMEPGATADAPTPLAALPGFGHGAHACPGRSWAHAMAVAALRVLTTGGWPPSRAASAHRGFRASLNARIPSFDPTLEVTP
ncbi:MAG: cytochrome P450 [Comamonadaceae bacterium]|nr:MAG: cytochrome P450 [Comamonadaceae bacterium]